MLYIATMKAVIYTRLSRDTEASTSIQRQEDAAQRLCNERGWDVVTVLQDVDISATKRGLDRPGLDQARAMYPDIDALVFWRVDRLARSLSNFVELMDEAEKHNVALVSATEPIDLSSPMGRAMAQLLGIFAELEARNIGARVASTWKHLKTVGRATGGIRLYGYRQEPNPDGAGYILVPDPAETAIVLEVVDRVLRRESLTVIARDLNQRRVPNRKPDQGTWNPTGLKRLLQNPGLQGYVKHQGQLLKDDLGLPIQFWEPVVPPSLWRQVQDELERRSQSHRRHGQHNWLLMDVIQCGQCGRRMYPRADKTWPNYHCSAYANGKGCGGVSIRRDWADEYVAEQFLATVGDWPVVEVVPQPVQVDEDAVEATRTALSDLEGDRYQRGLFPGPEGAARFAELHQGLTARLAALESARAGEPEVRRTGQTFREAFDQADEVGRRMLVARALDAVVVQPSAGRGGTVEHRRKQVGVRIALVWSGAG